MTDRKIDKFAFFLPNIFTSLNMGCGFMAILFALKGQYNLASMLIVLGALFDSVDGRVARLTGTQSSFGEQFDSLSDLISFGIAPSLIFYLKFLSDDGRIGMLAAFIYLLCGALRLARFNANIDKVSSDYFQGLPIPGAASAIIGFIMVSVEFESIIFDKIAIAYILFYGVLMISNIPFPSFKNSEWIRQNKRKVLFIIILVLSSLFIYEEVMIFSIISFYVIASIIYRLTHKDKFKDIFHWEEPASHESN